MISTRMRRKTRYRSDMSEKFIPKFFGKKVNGQFKFDRGEENKYRAYLYKIKDGDPMFAVFGHKTKATVRSVQQNRYYFGVCVDLLAAHTGYTADEMHEALKWKFLIIHRDGLPDTVPSTANLTKDQFCEYIDKIQQWAARDMGCVIPDPDGMFDPLEELHMPKERQQ
jgi:hypothetical protein